MTTPMAPAAVQGHIASPRYAAHTVDVGEVSPASPPIPATRPSKYEDIVTRLLASDSRPSAAAIRAESEAYMSSIIHQHLDRRPETLRLLKPLLARFGEAHRVYIHSVHIFYFQAQDPRVREKWSPIQTMQKQTLFDNSRMMLLSTMLELLDRGFKIDAKMYRGCEVYRTITNRVRDMEIQERRVGNDTKQDTMKASSPSPLLPDVDKAPKASPIATSPTSSSDNTTEATTAPNTSPPPSTAIEPPAASNTPYHNPTTPILSRILFNPNSRAPVAPQGTFTTAAGDINNGVTIIGPWMLEKSNTSTAAEYVKHTVHVS